MKDTHPTEHSFSRNRPVTLVALLALGAITLLLVCVYFFRTRRDPEPPPYPGKFEHGYGGCRAVDNAMFFALGAIRQRDFAKAIPVLEEALQEVPEHMGNRELLIICLWATRQDEAAMKQVDVAIDYFNSFTPADQKYAASHMISILELRGLRNIGLDDLQASEADAERMKQLDPDNYRAYKILAMVAEKRNDFDAMGEYAAEAVKKFQAIEHDRVVTEMLERANALKIIESEKSATDMN